MQIIKYGKQIELKSHAENPSRLAAGCWLMTQQSRTKTTTMTTDDSGSDSGSGSGDGVMSITMMTIVQIGDALLGMDCDAVCG